MWCSTSTSTSTSTSSRDGPRLLREIDSGARSIPALARQCPTILTQQPTPFLPCTRPCTRLAEHQVHLALLVWLKGASEARKENFCQLASQAGAGAGVGGLVEVAATSSSSRTGLETSAPAGGELHLPPATPTCQLSWLTRMQDWKMRQICCLCCCCVIFVAVVLQWLLVF